VSLPASRGAGTGDGAAGRDRPIGTLFLSPHLDDAVLSCGGQIHRRAAAGERVVVLTVFAGTPEGGPTLLAAELHSLWGLPAEPSEALAARVAEDDRALAVLHAEPERWGLIDAVYRGRAAPTGLTEASYPTLRSLFGPPRDQEDERGLARVIAELLRALPPAAAVYAPLGVGRHVDHVLVQRAATEVFRDHERLLFYEELPYARRLFSVRRALRAAAVGSASWSAEIVPLTAGEIDAKCRAIACYASQLAPVYRDEDHLRRAVKAALHRGGERSWRLGRRSQESG
jgi:LmbE family N-acetylglucosaminyl deacetylase